MSILGNPVPLMLPAAHIKLDEEGNKVGTLRDSPAVPQKQRAWT